MPEPIATPVPELPSEPVERRAAPVEPRPVPVETRATRVETRAAPAEARAGRAAPPIPVSNEPKLVEVQFRVRPYAQVYLDGRPLGETPFGPVRVSPGTHQVRLVNPDLKKEVTVTLKVRSGRPMVFPYSFLE